MQTGDKNVHRGHANIADRLQKDSPLVRLHDPARRSKDLFGKTYNFVRQDCCVENVGLTEPATRPAA